jgi:hypothetical protein
MTPAVQEYQLKTEVPQYIPKYQAPPVSEIQHITEPEQIVEQQSLINSNAFYQNPDQQIPTQ